jgi:F-type H+-transporting ATPase subunit delta
LIAGSVAKRYAKALAEVAAGSQMLEVVRDDLRAFVDLLRGHRELRQFLANPSVSRRDAAETVKEIGTSMRLVPLTATFLQIVLEGGRIVGLDGILRAYEALVDDQLGRVRAAVTSAAPLTTEAQDRLRQRLSEVAGKTVYLDVKEDPALLGGLVAQIGSRIYDGSLKTQLARMRDELARA